MKWWQWRPDLLSREVSSMKNVSNARLELVDNHLAWVEWITTNFGETYGVTIVYPNRYPKSPPQAFIIEPEIDDKAPHRFLDGSLCLFPPEDIYTNPNLKRAKHIRGLACFWLFCYTTYRETGQWPAPSTH